MSCNPTRILLSNSGATTMNVTVSPDPGDGVSVTFQVDGLTISDSEPTSSGTAAFSIATVAAVNNSLWDATLQIGSNTPVEAEVQVVESNGSQTIGVTLTDSEVTYCSPTSTGGSGSVTEVTGVTPILVADGTTTPEVSLDDAGITTAKIADDAVTSPKIADDAVTHGKIADLAVEHGKIGLAAVQTTNIQDNAVTDDKLADTAVTPGSYTTADITVDAQGRITSASTGSPPAGTVTSVTAGSGLTGGTITSSGTIAHGPGTFVGSEEYPVKIVVDSFGHIQVNESESTAGAYRTAVGADDADNLTSGTVAIARGGTGSATAPMIGVVTAANSTAARTVLGLGTAATQDVGTSGQNVVQLDNASRLPAVDGSQLINLPSSGGGSTDWKRDPDATTVRLFEDLYSPVAPINGTYTYGIQNFLHVGDSSTSPQGVTRSGANGAVLATLNGQYDRLNYWGPRLFDGSDLQSGDEYLFEGRIQIDWGNSTGGYGAVCGFMQDDGLAANGRPPATFYTSARCAGLSFQQGNTYATKFVKDNTNADTPTNTNTTTTTASVDATWIRVANHAVWDAGNSRWDITHYIDGVSVGTSTLQNDAGKALLPYVSATSAGITVSGTCEVFFDWVQMQYKKASANTYLDIDDI